MQEHKGMMDKQTKKESEKIREQNNLGHLVFTLSSFSLFLRHQTERVSG